MSALFSWPMLWAQAVGPATKAATPNLPPVNIPRQWLATIEWIALSGDPMVRTNDLLGAVLTWLKAMGLLCLIGWLLCWLIVGVKERVVGRGRWYDYLGLLAIVLTPSFVMVRELEAAKRIPEYVVPLFRLGSMHLPTFLAVLCVLLYLIWIEIAIGRTILRFGRRLDFAVLFLLHVALFAGLAAGVAMQRIGFLQLVSQLQGARPRALNWLDGLVYGARMSGTYMGYVVLARVITLCVPEVAASRFRRLYSIARLSIAEATRRMWAPWVVLAVFVLVLLFTHWFLQPPRAAEMGRLYVGTLTLLCSILLTVMVTILTPLSLPTDIQQQTIYTVVSKPVRRLELVWGRMIGYMTIVTVLIGIFGLISLAYLKRTVGETIRELDAQAARADQAKNFTEAKQLREQAEQCRTRMTARVPVKGSLSFLDSRGVPHAMGIDVGMEQSMREPRSHIEGATPSSAIWSFGVVPDPFTPPGRQPVALDRRIPVKDFLKPGTMEAVLDRFYDLRMQVEGAKALKAQPNVTANRIRELDAAITRNQAELDRVKSDYDSLRARNEDLLSRADKAEADGDREASQRLRREAAQFASTPIMVEMSFNVYRTTKGRIGEPVYAEIQATNPWTGAVAEDMFPIKEYYTNRVSLPAWILAGSRGALKIEVHCMTANQYLGMAESDLYLLLPPGNFGFNYMKGLFGVWLQAMVLTAIGVWAGTFLSWPVALLTTIAFFVAGQLAFSFLVDFTRQAIMGGGPFESLIRLLTHDNQMSELTPTAAVVLAKTLDSLVMPLMSLLVYVVPNFQALDVSNMVADGFAVGSRVMVSNTLLALAYALPFSFLGFLILKNREVAA